MASKELLMCLFLLNDMILTNLQVIHNQQDRCNSNVDNDLLLKVREMQLELAAYREFMEQSMKTERLLQGQITQLIEEFEEYKNGSIHNHTVTADELKKQGKYFIDIKYQRLCDMYTVYDLILLGTCLCLNCLHQFSWSWRVFSRLLTLNTPGTLSILLTN